MPPNLAVCLQTAREPNKVRADAKPSTLARRHADTGGERVKERERGKGRNTDRENFPEVRLLGIEDDDGNKSNYQTFNGILE